MKPCKTSLIQTLVMAVVCLVGPSSQASLEMDQRYRFDTVGVLRPADNMDGLLASRLQQAVFQLFSESSRFKVKDLTKTDDVLTRAKSIDYQKLILDPEVLRKVAEVNRLETLVRVQFFRDGAGYHGIIDWIVPSSGQMIGAEEFQMGDLPEGQPLTVAVFKEKLRDVVAKTVAAAPWKGSITGRDHETITLNLGMADGIRKGSTLQIATVHEVRLHPVLKQLVDWKLKPTGNAIVEDVDSGMAFARITEEFDVPVRSLQKIVEIEAPIDGGEDGEIIENRRKRPGNSHDSEDDSEWTEELPDQIQLGQLNAGLWMGSYSRNTSQSAASTGKNGGGVIAGPRLEGAIWLNRLWFADLNLGYGMAGFSQKEISTGVESTVDFSGVSAFQGRLGAGVHLYMADMPKSGRAWLRVNYQYNHYAMDAIQSESAFASSFSGLGVGLGGEFQLKNPWGFRVGIDLGVFNSASVSDASIGTKTSAQSLNFYAGALYEFMPNLRFHCGIDLIANSADFSSGTSLSHRIFAITPGVMFFF